MDVHQASSLNRTLISILQHPAKINLISDMAFQAIDDEGNADGDVDKGELGNVLRRVAEKMGIT